MQQQEQLSMTAGTVSEAVGHDGGCEHTALEAAGTAHGERALVRKGRLVFELPASNGAPIEASPFCILCGFCSTCVIGCIGTCTCPPPVCVCTFPCNVQIASAPRGQANEVVVAQHAR